MLQGLSIRNIVLIERLDLTLGEGLSVLTGETGAGKSIVLDSLELALGARADSSMIRHGEEQGSVAAAFSIVKAHPVWRTIRDLGLDADGDEIVLRRVIAKDGRSRAFINDQTVSIGALREIGDALVEIQGQHAERGLLNPAGHRDLLDAFAGHADLLDAVAAAYRAWKAAEEESAAAEAELRSARADEDYLRHVSEELSLLAPKTGEEEELAAERALTMNAEKIAADISDAYRAAAGEDGAEAKLIAAIRRLERAAGRAEGVLDPAIAALERAIAEAREATAAIEDLQDRLRFDPSRLETVEERLFALRAAARKHQCSVEGLPSVLADLEAKLAAIDTGDARLRALKDEASKARAAFLADSQTLSAARRRAASALDRAVTVELAPLMLGKARFETKATPLADADLGPLGGEQISFQVATAPGVPPAPLIKIASGGELSRFLLALRVALAGQGTAPTLVFDEVDRGVGGAVANAVGERLAALSRGTQVIVVTHSPQVAARADHHWRILKDEQGKAAKLVTSVEKLDDKARREEIARMLAGAHVTDAARAAADSLMRA